MHKEGLDEEWVELILAAKEIGLSKEDVSDFLKKDMIHAKKHCTVVS